MRCGGLERPAAPHPQSRRRDRRAHETVIRVNMAPTAGYENFTGSRTDLRVWGFVPLPRQSPRAAWAAEDNFLIYCPPVTWVSVCWRNIAVDRDPRLHPSAWRRAQRLIHLNRSRCKRMGCYPSSGAMAVLYAIDHCERTTIYGFGVAEPTAPEPRCLDPALACAPAGGPTGYPTARCTEAQLCAVGLACDKYYSAATRLEWRARRCEKARAGHVKRSGRFHVDYFKEAAVYHDVVQEWLWLARLHREGAVVWRGQPGPDRFGESGAERRMEP